MKFYSKRSITLAAGLGILVLSAAQAATAPAAVVMTAAGTAPALLPVITAEQYDKKIKDAEERGGRSIASAEVITEAALSDSFNKLRNRVLKITTADGLHALLTDLQNEEFYNKLDPDAKFAAAQMAPLLAFNGFFNRTIEWIEPAPITHLSAVALLRGLGAGVTVYFPTDQWQAGLKYLTVPNSKMGPIIDNELKFHAFLENELIPLLQRARTRLNELNFAAKPIYFDNKVFYGTANFVSDKDRFVRMGEAERHAALANVHYALSSVYSLNAYNLNGLFQAIDTLSKKVGFASAVIYNPEVTTDATRFEVLREQNRKTKLFDLRPNGQAWMTAAYNSLTWAVGEASDSWTELRTRSKDASSDGNLLDPRGTGPIARMMTSGLHNLHYIVYGTGTKAVTSAIVADESRTLNLANFYTPNAPASLIDLMPTGFDRSAYNPPKLSYEVRQPDGKVVKVSRKYHNFLSGRANDWPLAEYQRLFSKDQIKSGDDVVKTARILSQSWGGWLLGLPMTSLVL